MAKIGREAFLYLAPRKGIDDPKTFAQCGPCRVFVPEEELKGFSGDRCVFHGSKVKVDDDDSCGFMCPWPKGKPEPEVVADHAREIEKGIPGSVKPEVSGLVSKLVQCHRCVWPKDKVTKCGLYERLNRTFPEIFDLDENIETHACCNAWDDDIQTTKGDIRAQIRGAMSRKS